MRRVECDDCGFQWLEYMEPIICPMCRIEERDADAVEYYKENQRLREALEKIADEKYSDCAWDTDDFHRIARAALEGE